MGDGLLLCEFISFSFLVERAEQRCEALPPPTFQLLFN